MVGKSFIGLEAHFGRVRRRGRASKVHSIGSSPEPFSMVRIRISHKASKGQLSQV